MTADPTLEPSPVEPPAPRGDHHHLEVDQRPRRGSSTGPVLVALLAGVLIGGLGVTLLARESSGASDPFGGMVDASRAQAVVLTTGRVYFGNLSSLNAEFYELDDAFYLREIRDTPDAEPVRTLLPLNREMHEPENRLLVRKDEVVLVENLAEDSPILSEMRRQVAARE